jgi:hypothetical protein
MIVDTEEGLLSPGHGILLAPRPRLDRVALRRVLPRARAGRRDAFLVHLLAFEVDANLRDFYLPCFPLLANPVHSLMTGNCAVVSMAVGIEPALA